MIALTHQYIHQDVLCVKIVGNLIISGVGGYLFFYQNGALLYSIPIFQCQQIHIIKSKPAIRNRIIVAGGRQLAVCSLVGQEAHVLSRIQCTDWVLDATFLSENQVLIATAHNRVQLWSSLEQPVMKLQSSCEEHCILYSCTLHHTSDGRLLVFAGTAFSEVIIWCPNISSSDSSPVLLHRMVGHEGVIFSIAVKELCENLHIICTTSDDRSIRIWSVIGRWGDAKISKTSALFAHTARVWKSIITSKYIVSIGEDSLLCLWSYEGKLVSKVVVHQGGLRAIDFSEIDQFFSTGGSDGGISRFKLEYIMHHSNSDVVNQYIRMNTEEIPRKVKFAVDCMSVCLTDKGRIVNENGINLVEENELKKCTDLEISPCKRYIAASTVQGRIHIYDLTARNRKVVEVNVRDGLLCQSLRWRGSKILVNVKGGQMILYKLNNSMELIEMGSFALPKSKDNAATCFTDIERNKESIILVGDRGGNLLIYKTNIKSPKQVINKLHSYLGMSDILYMPKSNTMLTVGAGGWIRELQEYENQFRLVRSSSIPLESVVKIVDGAQGVLALGFLGADFKVWDVQNATMLMSFNCGGGHRSWDFRFCDATMDFIYIKDKLVQCVSFPLNRITHIRDGHHGKTINALVVVGNYVISAGEDTTVRIAEISVTGIRTIYILEHHISSVRALTTCKISDNQILIVSAGGREQLSLTSFDTDSEQCCQLLSNFSNDTQAEGRYMCLETFVTQDGRIFILAGCSDCSVRLFLYDHCTLKIVHRVDYNKCILQVKVVRPIGYIFAVAFATDGCALFWDISGVLNDMWLEKQTTAMTLHSSGINSCQIQEREPNVFLMATGGDDNAIVVTDLRFVRDEDPKWRNQSSWSTSSVHSTQITGLVLRKNLLLSIGIDQILAVHQIEFINDSISLTLISTIMTSVPDVHGMAIQTVFTTHNLYIYGKGIHKIKADLRELEIDPDPRQQS